jgi:hypothetical protein
MNLTPGFFRQSDALAFEILGKRGVMLTPLPEKVSFTSSRIN